MNKPLALAESDGRLHPACGLWRTEVLDTAEAYAAEGRRSLRGLAERLGAAIAVRIRDTTNGAPDMRIGRRPRHSPKLKSPSTRTCAIAHFSGAT